MRYLWKVGDGVMIVPVMAQVMRATEWDTDEHREQIHLRTEAAPFWERLPPAKNIALSVMQAMSGSNLGSVRIARWAPAKKEPGDANADPTFEQFIVVLSAAPGAILMSGDESVPVKAGELWWMDVRQEHAIMNNSKDDLILMMIEVGIDP